MTNVPAETSASTDTYDMHAAKLNWLRAGVLGANDGIVSVAAILFGVIGAASSSPHAIAAAGIAGLIAGSLSMAMGEYVSVSAARDAQKARNERHDQRESLLNAWHASAASLVAFAAGGVLPLVAALLCSDGLRLVITVTAVVISLILTGVISAHLSHALVARSILRNVVGGLLAMAVTYSVGLLVGAFVLT